MQNKVDDMDNEGKKEIDRLRKEYVISKDELNVHREQQLLRKMYECHEEMADLLDNGKEDPHYVIMGELIKRLENYLQGNQNLI